MQDVTAATLLWTRLDARTEACDLDGGRLVLTTDGRQASCGLHGPWDRIRGHGASAALPFERQAAMTFETADDAKRMLALARCVTSFGSPSRLLTASGFENVFWTEHRSTTTAIWSRRDGRTRQEISVADDLVEFHEHRRHQPKRLVMCLDMASGMLPKDLRRPATATMIAIRLADERLANNQALAA